MNSERSEVVEFIKAIDNMDLCKETLIKEGCLEVMAIWMKDIK